MSATTSLQSRVIETKLLKWKEFQFMQQDQFKDLSPEASDKLKKSILENQFTQPFYAWFDPESAIYYCLDGFHRVKMLRQLVEDNYRVPDELPATLIDCADKQEAAKLVLIYSSIYAKINATGFTEFIEQFNLDEQLLKMQISIPGITDIFLPEMPLPEELIGEPKDKPAVMKITFKSVEALEEAKHTIEKVLEEIAEDYIISVSAGEI